MEYDETKFTADERNEIIDWLSDKSTVGFFAGLLKNKKKTNILESDNPLNDDNSTLDIKTMTSLQFYKLIDLLEVELDLYAAYGYNTRKYAETEKLKRTYMSHAGKTWEQIKKEAEEAESVF
jgi:hypothetical protein